MEGNFTITISGPDGPAILKQLKTWTDVFEVVEAAQAGGPANGRDDTPAPSPVPVPEQPQPPAAPQGTRRRRGREAAASQDDATPPAAAAAPAPAIKSKPNGLADRAAMMDLLKKCYSHSPEGAAKVIALQKQFGVARFAEIADAQVGVLHDMATALWDELSGTASNTDAGPF